MRFSEKKDIRIKRVFKKVMDECEITTRHRVAFHGYSGTYENEGVLNSKIQSRPCNKYFFKKYPWNQIFVSYKYKVLSFTTHTRERKTRCSSCGYIYLVSTLSIHFIFFRHICSQQTYRKHYRLWKSHFFKQEAYFWYVHHGNGRPHSTRPGKIKFKLILQTDLLAHLRRGTLLRGLHGRIISKYRKCIAA